MFCHYDQISEKLSMHLFATKTSKIVLSFFSAIALILFEKKLRQLHHVFFVNLALCDFGVMVIDVFVLLGAIYGKEFYIERPIMCEISGFVCMMSCFGSLWTMMFIALNRFSSTIFIASIKHEVHELMVFYSCFWNMYHILRKS